MLDITDIHIKTSQSSAGIDANLEASLLFPHLRPPDTEEERRYVYDLFRACMANNFRSDDFMVSLRDTFYRCRRDRFAIDGEWLRLRKMAKEPPTFDKLPTKLDPHIVQTLLSPSLSRGGLIFITGGPGCGKTTTASATVVSRLMTHGGVAYTVEDPPELPLNGRHGNGYCTQTIVAGESANDWAESLRGVLRSQPVGMNLMLFVGEIRDPLPAKIMLRAASNGFLTVCTAFGADIVSGIDSLFQLVGSEYAATLANVLRVVICQRVIDGRFQAEMLTSDGPNCRVAVAIRNGMVAQIKDELLYQKNAALALKGPQMGRTVTKTW